MLIARRSFWMSRSLKSKGFWIVFPKILWPLKFNFCACHLFGEEQEPSKLGDHLGPRDHWGKKDHWFFQDFLKDVSVYQLQTWAMSPPRYWIEAHSFSHGHLNFKATGSEKKLFVIAGYLFDLTGKLSYCTLPDIHEKDMLSVGYPHYLCTL